MQKAKKDRPKAATFERHCPGLAPGNLYKVIISNSRQNASPNLDGEGGFFPMYLGFILAVIGAACVTSGLMRAIDSLESH